MVIIGLAKIIRSDILQPKQNITKKTSAGIYRYLWWIRLLLTCWQWFHSGRIQSQWAWPRTAPAHSVAVGSASSPSAVDQQHSYVWWTAGPKIMKSNVHVPMSYTWRTCPKCANSVLEYMYLFVFIRYSIIFVLFVSSDKRWICLNVHV